MPVGAIGAINAARKQRPAARSNVSPERAKAMQEEIDRRQELTALFEKHDTNKSLKLEEDQVRKLLTELDTSTPPDTPPSDEELKFIMTIADQDQAGGISRQELDFAVKAWGILTSKRTKIEEALKNFDKSGTGKLERNELKAYLTSLNENIEVDEEEVDWVLSKADVFGDGACSKPELVMATAAWYSHVKEKDVPPPQQSACCTTM